MWRLILLLILLAIAYFLIRSAVRGLFGKGRAVGRVRDSSSVPAGEMVQDPLCGLYVPKDGAYFLREGEQTHFFCSETCRASYQEKLTSA